MTTPYQKPSQVTAAAQGKSFFGQSRMQFNLFSVELWDRFPFYEMQRILSYSMSFTSPTPAWGSTRRGP